MQKKVKTKAVLFKAILVAVLGIFFFVQAQSEFIYCANDNSFAPSAHHKAPPAGTRHAFLYANKAGKKNVNHLKLSKRYQLVTTQAIMPGEILMPVCQVIKQAKWCTPPVYFFSRVAYTTPLRGPPFI